MGNKNTSTAVYDIAVIGGGASGCMAAISAAQNGAKVILLDRNEKLGKKLYATGNGRCNLTNYAMSSDCYHAVSARTNEEQAETIDRITAILDRFSERDLVDFWETQGIFVHDRNGYVYPRTDQAETVVHFLEKKMRELHVDLSFNEDVVEVQKDSSASTKFQIRTKNGLKYQASRVILCVGGMAGPQYGCDEGGYRLARKLGHSVTPCFPALVPLSTADPILKFSAGVRCDARITLCRRKGTNFLSIASERGELQLLKDRLSGIPVFQISKYAGDLISQGVRLIALIDFLPEFTENQWKNEKLRRLREDRNCMLADYMGGLVNRKVLDMILAQIGLQAEKKASKLSEEQLADIMDRMRGFSVAVDGTGNYKQAQVTAGGVPMKEVDDNLQSLRCPGFYLAGEVLDIDGICGGYNLQFAFSTGYLAGRAATRKDIHD